MALEKQSKQESLSLVVDRQTADHTLVGSPHDQVVAAAVSQDLRLAWVETSVTTASEGSQLPKPHRQTLASKGASTARMAG